MKVILSRKGLDSGVSDLSNLRLINTKNNKAKLIMIPIPDEKENYSYKDLVLDKDETNSNVIKKSFMQSKKLTEQSKCHADPNLVNFFNEKEFLGSIGQVDSSQTHLKNKGVTIGDLFIFFGAFADCVTNNENIVIYKNNKNHIMFGYLQIGDIIYPNNLTVDERKDYEKKYPWLKRQPHWTGYKNKKNNCIYVARETCTFDNTIKGYGAFDYDNEKLHLTKKDDVCVTHWNLPKELQGLNISYHTKDSHKENYFQAACRGQEFVIEECKQAEKWAINLIKRSNCYDK